jgi:hypothetical protein
MLLATAYAGTYFLSASLGMVKGAESFWVAIASSSSIDVLIESVMGIMIMINGGYHQIFTSSQAAILLYRKVTCRYSTAPTL